MATYPVFTVGDGVIEIPARMQNDPRLAKGSHLLLMTSGGSIVLEPEKGSDTTQGDWRRLRGVLAHIGRNLNEDLESEKQRELLSDERIMRGTLSE